MSARAPLFVTEDGRFNRQAIRAEARRSLAEFRAEFPDCPSRQELLKRQALRSALMAALPEMTRWNFANLQRLIAVSPEDARQLSSDGPLS